MSKNIKLPPIKQVGEVTEIHHDETPLPGEKPLAQEGVEPVVQHQVKLIAACGNCAFMMMLDGKRPEPEEYDKVFGQCRRHPPQCIPVGIVRNLTGQEQVSCNGFFPPVRCSTWCGDWHPDPDTKARMAQSEGNA